MRGQAPVQHRLPLGRQRLGQTAGKLQERRQVQPVDAHQYRTVAARLAEMLADRDIDWQPLLEQSPAAAALYENLHYGDAGLCRSPLDEAMRAEMAACDAIAAARARPSPDTAAPGAASAA